jgi:glyoxylase-like metal-dependent hydrolase (beta-lactamase superfamily II)
MRVRFLPGHPDGQAPAHGRLVEAAPGVLWTRFPLPYRLNHVNVYLFEDEGGWTVFDAATDGVENRGLWTGLLGRELGGRPVRRILVSHFHPDHVGAAGWLGRRTGAPVVMSRREHRAAVEFRSRSGAEYLDRLRGHFIRHGIAPGESVAEAGGQHDYGAYVGGLPEEISHVAEGDVLSIGGRDFRVLTGAGHSPELVMLHNESDRLLIGSDQILARITPNISVMAAEPEANPLSDYLRSLGALRRIVSDDVLVLPGHEMPFVGLHARIDELIEHHRLRCAEAVAACRQAAATARDLVPSIFGRDFSGESLGIAVCEAIAHTNMLVDEGHLEAFPQSGRIFYRVS